MALSRDDLHLLLNNWTRAFQSPEAALEQDALVRSGALNLSALVAQAPDAAWVESALAGLGESAPSERYLGATMNPPPPRHECFKRLYQALLDAGAKPFAARPPGLGRLQGRATTLDMLLGLGWHEELRAVLARPDAPTPAQLDQRPSGEPLLVEALHAYSLESIEVLLAHGCSPDVLDTQGRPALGRAFRLPQVQVLLDRGADLAQASRSGQSVLDIWRSRFTLADLAPFQRLWQERVAPPDTDAGRLDAVRRGLDLRGKGRVETLLRQVGLKGHECDAQGQSLLDIAANKILSMLGRPEELKPEALQAVWHKGRRSIQLRPEGALRFGMAALASGGWGVSPWAQEALLAGGARLEDPATMPSAAMVTNDPFVRQIINGNLALLWLSAPASIDKVHWRDWVHQPEYASVRHDLLASAMNSNLHHHCATMLGHMVQHREWMSQGDPWAIVLPALARLTTTDNSRERCPLGLLQSKYSSGKAGRPAESALHASHLARELCEQGVYPTPAAWERWAPILDQTTRDPTRAPDGRHAHVNTHFIHWMGTVVLKAALESVVPESGILRPKVRL